MRSLNLRLYLQLNSRREILNFSGAMHLAKFKNVARVVSFPRY
ncbi:hypothetical protein CAMGR0001_1611 [Campylobacter gracilis RM3268]|uniref:Uncharacterized protein n=1 Tax=Campylobacter gracilis RM3268 TaxID=553220 RepID=C8PIF0_9BACT|nr:hypothetical protein CAMGR0001_1611 [Campylobacter gracilis RM3268]